MAAVTNDKVYSFVSPTLISRANKYYQDHHETQNAAATRSCLEALNDVRNIQVHIGNAIANVKASQSPIEIWNAKNASRPVFLGSEENRLSGEAFTNFRNLKSTDGFFRMIYKRPPINTGDKLIKSYIEHPQAYNNALYLSSDHCVYYGEVDPRVFNPLINNPEITTHELGHAVTDFSSGLEYQFQSGALDESLADVFAIIHKQYKANVRAGDPNASWVVGEGVVAFQNGNSQSLRSLSHPGQAFRNHPVLGDDDQPSHMNAYARMDRNTDNGGVHTNSGIPNHAFYLAAKSEGGFSWEKIGQIWFQALISANPNEDFSAFAQRTFAFANKSSGQLAQIVGKAWTDVGVDMRMPSLVMTRGDSSQIIRTKRSHFVDYLAIGIIAIGVLSVMTSMSKSK